METETNTLEAEAGFRALFQYATVGIIVVNREGKIELANPNAEELFGYQNEELIGQRLEVLIPQHLKQKHVAHREHYFEKPKARPMGRGTELYALKKNGEEFPVEISLGNYELDGEMLAVAFITDISGGTIGVIRRSIFMEKSERMIPINPRQILKPDSIKKVPLPSA